MPVHPLCTAREAKGLSMRQLSSLAGLGTYGHRRIYGWEHGETIPTSLYANALAPHLDYKSGEELREVCIRWKKEREAVDENQEGTSHPEACDDK
jgi:transcriptional regulator with XRE-family HTH domain